MTVHDEVVDLVDVVFFFLITATPAHAHTNAAYRCSPSTSQTKGRIPSAPPGTRRSTKEQTNARAAAQESKDHHKSLQVCSTRLRNNGGSERALNCAKDLMNVRVSSDHRPPTSPANTTNRHRLLCPESSGYRRSFRHLATLRATPSLRAAPGRAVPSA